MNTKLFTLLVISGLLMFMGSCSQDSNGIRDRNETVQTREGNEDENEAIDDAHEEENEVEIDVKSLPESIRNGIASRYPGAQLKESDKITHNDGTITYDVEIIVEGEVIEVMYGAEGGYLGEEADD